MTNMVLIVMKMVTLMFFQTCITFFWLLLTFYTVRFLKNKMTFLYLLFHKI